MSFNPLNLTGRRYLITGAASGIGRATAIYLSRLGADLALCDINAEGLQKLAGELNTAYSNIIVDLSQISALSEVITADVEVNGKLNGIVHCAGLPYVVPLKMVNIDNADKILKINTLSGLQLAKVFTNKRIYQGSSGSIVFISSVYGLVGSAANSVYALSKGAIQSMTRSLAIELSSRGVRVNCIAPGFVRSEMAELVNKNFDPSYEQHIEHLHPLGWGKPEDIAAGVAYLLSDMSLWVTGSIISIDGGFTAQ